LLGILNTLGILLALNLWWLRISGRLAGEVDAPEIVLLYALATAAIAIVAMAIAVVAVIAKSVTARWLSVPTVVLSAAIIGICTVASDLQPDRGQAGPAIDGRPIAGTLQP
jgi:hypothetical protein